ncbi:hypothetical protein ABVT39_019895 [Epinephelus coioides]
MSVPFSNTHLRVPRGFGTILEGLTREILRDQPEDIPKYAAQYFEALLRKREESGMDPAEWAAKLEDRFYNNHAFKATEVSVKEEPAAEETSSKEKSDESQTDDEHSHSAEASHVSTTQPNVSEEADLSESTGEERKHDITEEHVVEKGPSEEESVNRLQDVQPDDLSGTEEERDPIITELDQVDRAANGNDSSSASDRDKPQSELEPTDLSSFRGISNVDVCAQELGMAQDEGGDKKEFAVVDEEIEDSEGEENIDNDEPVEVPPYSGLADVDVCATELGGTQVTMEEATAEDDMQVTEEDTSTPKPEEAVVRSSSQSKTLEGNQHEAEDEAETKEEEGTETEASSGGIHESLAHIEGGFNSNALPMEDSLVEISFEDIPEAQQIEEVEEKQPEEEGLQSTILETQLEEESEEATDQNISSTQDQSEPEMMGVEKEVNSELEEMQTQQEASDKMKEKVDSNDSNVNDSDDDEKHEGVKTIGSSHQPTTEADEGNPEDETDHKNEDSEKISEGEFHRSEDPEKEAKSNDPDIKGDETTDASGEDKKDIHTKGYSKVEDQEIDGGGADNPSSQVFQSNISTARTEAESETLEASAQHLSGEIEESQRTLVESQLEETVVEKEVTSNELVEEGQIDSDAQEKNDAMGEEGSIGHTLREDQLAADQQGEDGSLGPEMDSTEPENKSVDKEECSRPQEEEDIMDIPLDDPEANRAAAKIQAGFRGHMTRKKMKPEDKAEGEEVSSTGDVLNGSQGDTETGGSGAVERDDTSVPEQ